MLELQLHVYPKHGFNGNLTLVYYLMVKHAWTFINSSQYHGGVKSHLQSWVRKFIVIYNASGKLIPWNQMSNNLSISVGWHFSASLLASLDSHLGAKYIPMIFCCQDQSLLSMNAIMNAFAFCNALFFPKFSFAEMKNV